MDPIARTDVAQLLPLVAVDARYLAEHLFHCHQSTARRWIARERIPTVDAGSALAPAVLVADVLRALGLDPDTGEAITGAPVQLTLIERPERARKAAGS